MLRRFHDTANAIATVVATRGLSPGKAVLMAGVLNFTGALSGTGWGSIQFAGLEKTFEGLLFSPMLGFAGAFLMMVLLLNLFVRAVPATGSRVFGRAQMASAAWVAFSHGSNDAQKSMGVMTMAVASYAHWGGPDWQVPLWIIVGAAIAMGLGTSIGGGASSARWAYEWCNCVPSTALPRRLPPRR